MAVTAHLRWLCLWWGLLLCTLPVAQAATRQHVTMPSNLTATATGVATKGQGVLHVGVMEGEYIAANRMNRKVPIKVLKTIDYSIPRTINQAKGLLKANLGQVVLGGVIAGALASVDWLMEEGVKPGGGTEPQLVKKVPGTVHGIGLPYYGEGDFSCGFAHANPDGVYRWGGGWVFVVQSNTPYTKAPFSYINNCVPKYVSSAMERDFPLVVSPESTVPVTDEEIDQKFGDFAAAQDADWLNSLLRESCAGSLSPEACMQSLRDNVSTSGPATVPGESTTTTGTYTRPDGTTGTTQTTSNTTYNIKYGPTYFDWTENKTVIHHKDGQKTGEETTTEGDEPVDEQSPEDDEHATPMPCGGDCEGPAYQDLYEPTSETRESIIDDYMARARAAPILAAVGGFFDVSGNAACPIWSQHVYADMGFTALDWTLTFDFFCTELALGLYPWASSVLCLVAAWVAFRWGILE